MESESGDAAYPPPQQQQQQGRRSICCKCDRPLPVCLCHVIPRPPIPTTTRVIIIQHPHEYRHKLSTTPLLTKSLLNSTSIVARRLTPDLLLDQPLPAAFYLFPPSASSPAAVTLSQLKNSQQFRERNADNAPALLLIVFDATWKHAREMVTASEAYLSEFATRVCLDGFDEGADGGSIYDSALVLRKEPCSGCVSTMEAVARWLGAVEPNGPEIEAKLIGVLREAVRLQAHFLKPMNPRPKLLKKKKKNCTEHNNKDDAQEE